jgi:hypothetical protein
MDLKKGSDKEEWRRSSDEGGPESRTKQSTLCAAAIRKPSKVNGQKEGRYQAGRHTGMNMLREIGSLDRKARRRCKAEKWERLDGQGWESCKKGGGCKGVEEKE